jgi:hypothetical protein
MFVLIVMKEMKFLTLFKATNAFLNANFLTHKSVTAIANTTAQAHSIQTRDQVSVQHALCLIVLLVMKMVLVSNVEKIHHVF